MRTLIHSGLMNTDEAQGGAPVITRSGFQFLLMERSSQVREITIRLVIDRDKPVNSEFGISDQV